MVAVAWVEEVGDEVAGVEVDIGDMDTGGAVVGEEAGDTHHMVVHASDMTASLEPTHAVLVSTTKSSRPLQEAKR